MKHQRILRFGLVLLLAVMIAGCASGKKQFDLGIQLKEAGNYQQAIAYLEQALAQEPNNEKYRRTLAELKNALVADLVRQGEEALRTESPPSIVAVNKAKSSLAEAEAVDPAHPAVVDFAARLKQEETALVDNVKGLYRRAEQDISQEKWMAAHSSLQQVQRLFPDYENTEGLLRQVSEKGAEVLYRSGKERFDQEDFKAAADQLRQALSLQPGHGPSAKLLAAAVQNDSKDYFVRQGKAAVQQQKWDRAHTAYQRALQYDPADEQLKLVIGEVDYKAVFYHIRESRSAMYAGWLFQALESYRTAARYAADANLRELDSHLAALVTELTAQAARYADSLKSEANYGCAWFWYHQVKAIDPDYPELFYNIQETEDEINQRLKKSIAVFDFEAPTNAPDAGKIFANNLSTFLFKTASKDIKILERENLQSILEEMKLGQIGVVSAQTAQEMGRVYGIDVAVMGSVLRYNVDSTSYSDTKTVAYPVKKIEENIAYLNWKARNPNPTKEQLDKAPMPYIENMVDVEKEYNVSTHKKVAFVSVSFRIVDVKTGENILVDTIPRTKTATDNTSAGVQVAGIKFDPLEIPTDTEMLLELTNEVISDLGKETLKPMNNLQKIYYELGETHMRRGNWIGAAEHFIDAMFDERLKGIDEPKVAKNAQNHLEAIFRKQPVPFEG